MNRSALVGLAAIVSGCATYRPIAPEPRPPSPPTALAEFDYRVEVPTPTANNRDALVADRVAVLGVPGALPLTRGQRVVVAVPKDAIGNDDAGQGKVPTQSEETKELRASLIAAFLGAGFKVKDAGVIQLPSLSIRSDPRRDRSRTVTEVVQTGEGTTRTTETESRKDPWYWWWASEGLKIVADDPTSLWVTDLLDYKDLEADVFFRIFTVKVEAGYQNVDVTFQHTPEELADYRTRLEDGRRMAAQYNERRATYLAEVERYERDYAAYVAEHRTWEADTAGAHADQRLSVPKARGRARVAVPEPPPAYTEDALRAARANRTQTMTIEKVRVRLLAEAVSATNGQVLWVGSVVGETAVPSGGDRRQALFSIVRVVLEKMLGG